MRNTARVSVAATLLALFNCGYDDARRPYGGGSADDDLETDGVSAPGSGGYERYHFFTPMLERALRAETAITEVSREMFGETDLSSAEHYLLARNCWRQMEVHPELLGLLPLGGERVSAVAQFAQAKLEEIGQSDQEPPPLQIKPPTSPEFSRDLGNLIDLAVGTAQSFGAPPDPLGTEHCLTIIVYQILPAVMQFWSADTTANLGCSLMCLRSQLEVLVGWCVVDADATLSNPVQTLRDMREYLTAFCAPAARAPEGLCGSF